MTVFAVMVDAHGAWEADCLYSLWSSQETAEAECKRLNDKQATEGTFSLGCYAGTAWPVQITVDMPSDKFLSIQEM